MAINNKYITILIEMDVSVSIHFLSSLLKKLVKVIMILGMCDLQVRELEVLLLHLADLSHIQSSKEYVEAWELVLFTPFVKGNFMVLANW
jgi:hypothetical protein